MTKIRVTAVSYLNTVPLLYGIRHSEVMKAIDLQIAPPSVCARRLEEGATDISLIPVAALSNIPNHQIIGDYCIGATGKVRTVVLLSNHELQDIRTIYLDPDSRTSVMLVQILAKFHWHITPVFQPYSEHQSIGNSEACVLIGDTVFAKENQFIYRYDLAEHWIRFSGLPFVFAVWASTCPLSASFIKAFNNALHFGIHHIPDSLTEPPPCARETAIDYLTNNISYSLDTTKKNGLNTFRNFLNEYKA